MNDKDKLAHIESGTVTVQIGDSTHTIPVYISDETLESVANFEKAVHNAAFEATNDYLYTLKVGRYANR